MYEIQNAKSSNNSPLRDGLCDMMQRNRGSLTDGTLMPNAWRAAGGSGAGGGNFLPVNQQKSVSTTSSQDAGAQGPKPSYVPPIQTRDAQGKTLPQYRMGIGHRILGTLANFANGFAGNHAQPIYVGPGALNNRYYQEEAQRQQQNLENNLLQRAADRHRDAIDWRTIMTDPVSGKWVGTTFGGQRQEIGTPPWVGPEDEDEDENDGGTNKDAPGVDPQSAAPVGGQPKSAARRRFGEVRKGKSYR